MSSSTCGDSRASCAEHILSQDDTNDLNVFIEQKNEALTSTLLAHKRLGEVQDSIVSVKLRDALAKHGLKEPGKNASMKGKHSLPTYLLDREKQRVYSELIRRANLQLPEFVKLLRGETVSDSRPNKALHIPSGYKAWNSYPYKKRWASIVNNGVIPAWKIPFPRQVEPPKNHGSAQRAMNTIVKGLRAGQDADRYLILDIDLLDTLEGITCSPFGAVQKGDVPLEIDARIIHDLSFPKGSSVNDNTLDCCDVTITYDGAASIAHRILDVAEAHPGRQSMMTGDVNGAFRHIPLAASEVGRFAGTVPELGVLVIDLCCPFGWSQSPASYWVAGAAINHIYGSSGPHWSKQPACGQAVFDAKAWCDDHSCVEPDVGSRLQEANLALRSSMIAVLGPEACNEKKFTNWFQKGRALGLDWDLTALIVSMPPDKIDKALDRVRDMASRTRTTRTRLNKLLGSLRHVVTCIRPAGSFFQRLAALAREAPRFGTVIVTSDAQDDLRWFFLILHTNRLNSIPLTRFGDRQTPDYEIFMDASDRGICVVCPSRREFIQVEFSVDEREEILAFNNSESQEFGINVRELMSAVFAAIVWGGNWGRSKSPVLTHVRMRIDNTAAVSWTNRRFSRNRFAQTLLRILSLIEVRNGFYCTATHIAGVDNIMADAGSRVWQSPELAQIFTDISSQWLQVRVPDDSRNLSLLWERFCEQGL